MYFDDEVKGEDNSEAFRNIRLEELKAENEELKKEVKQLKGVVLKFEKEVVELKQIIKR